MIPCDVIHRQLKVRASQLALAFHPDKHNFLATRHTQRFVPNVIPNVPNANTMNIFQIFIVMESKNWIRPFIMNVAHSQRLENRDFTIEHMYHMKTVYPTRIASLELHSHLVKIVNQVIRNLSKYITIRHLPKCILRFGRI
jgi:hypothetical protein